MGDFTEGQAAPAVDVPATPLDELRAEIAKDIEVPRLFKRFTRVNGRLAGEFRTSKKKEVREAAAAENDEYILIECLIRILIEDKEKADPSTPEGKFGLVPLGLWAGRPDLDPLRIDNRLCDLLGLKQWGDPRKIALDLYEGNDLVLAEVAGEIAGWSLEVHNKAYQDFTTAS